jgi:hypothetical protein
MCQKVEFAGWARFKPKVTPYSLRDVDTPDHRRLRATSRDKAELAEPGSVPGYIESFTASIRKVHLRSPMASTDWPLATGPLERHPG